MTERVLTVKQPWASLIMAGLKTVENRSKPVPSTLPQWAKCEECGGRIERDSRGFVRLHSHEGLPADVVDDGPFPFRLWIHAGKGWDHAGNADTAMASVEGKLPLTRLPRGVLLGHVTVTGCHHAGECAVWDYTIEHVGQRHCSRWAQPDAFHWTLSDPVALPEPITMKGQLGVFHLPPDVGAAALAQLEGRAA